MNRREFSSAIGMTAALSVIPGRQSIGDTTSMFGLIAKIVATDGKRDELIAVLLGGTKGMPGCLSYVVSKDSTNDNTLWITEVWDSQANHQASLSLTSVQEAIAQGKPMISSFGERIETMPVGGHGLLEP